MNDLQIFSNPEFGEIRTAEISGEPYVVGVDVTRALEYAKPSQAVIDHCKGIRKLGIPSGRGVQDTNVIPEGDIYRLIIKAADQSRNRKIKEKAERFERWVFDEILPAIRKHGGYLTPAKVEEVLLDPDTIIHLATQLKEERTKRNSLETETAKQKQLIGEMKPKATYYDLVLNNKGLVAITQIAKDYGMSGQQLNAKLHELGVQYKLGKQWLLYAKFHDKGYTHSETIHFKHSDGRADTKLITKWTQAGRLFIYDLLKSKDILPVIEQDKTA